MDKLLNEILKIQSYSGNQEKMQLFLMNRYEDAEMDKFGNIYITKGKAENYPCVVAHLDTVHRLIEDRYYRVMEVENKIFAMNTKTMDFTGIGGDDKCGIYIALYCLEKFDNIKVAFFVDEEIGCVGSRDADMSFFDDVAYVIQCDRKGYTDVVTQIFGSELCSVDFQYDIAQLVTDYAKAFCINGGLTDVYQLKENGLKVSCMNLSCGYYRPHFDDEYIDLADLLDTRNFVVDVIEKLKDTKYEHEMDYNQRFAYYRGGKYNGYGSYEENKHWDDDGYDYPPTTEEVHVCPDCASDDTMIDDVQNSLWCFTCSAYTVDLQPSTEQKEIEKEV